MIGSSGFFRRFPLWGGGGGGGHQGQVGGGNRPDHQSQGPGGAHGRVLFEYKMEYDLANDGGDIGHSIYRIDRGLRTG